MRLKNVELTIIGQSSQEYLKCVFSFFFFIGCWLDIFFIIVEQINIFDEKNWFFFLNGNNKGTNLLLKDYCKVIREKKIWFNRNWCYCLQSSGLNNLTRDGAVTLKWHYLSWISAITVMYNFIHNNK